MPSALTRAALLAREPRLHRCWLVWQYFIIICKWTQLLVPFNLWNECLSLHEVNILSLYCYVYMYQT